MLDKTSKRVLDYLESKENRYDSMDGMARALGLKYAECKACCQYLEVEKMVVIEPQKIMGPMNFHIPEGVRLAHMGRNRGEFKKLSAMEYWKRHWIAFLALAISAGAFTLSLIALLN